MLKFKTTKMLLYPHNCLCIIEFTSNIYDSNELLQMHGMKWEDNYLH